MSGVGQNSELLNILGDVKAKVQDRLGVVDFPLPQFVLIGSQSVGKSRLIEALAGETFNFISGTLGSRRPTVLEFRNVSASAGSKWYVRDRDTSLWNEHPIVDVMKKVGDAHQELGETVSTEPIYVRIESPACVDMQIVDLPGFRDFALDASKQDLAKSIESMDLSFMTDPRNFMLCVEPCGDAATLSTLAKCRQVDPDFKRTILIRNKLDKYYGDLTPENVTKWVTGFGDLPENLERFALTLPWWKDGVPPPKNFVELREEFNQKDLQQLRSIGLDEKYMQSIGFKNFASHMETKIEQLFVQAIGPVLDKLKDLKAKLTKRESDLKVEHDTTDANRMETTTRDCGKNFASGLREVMQGQSHLKTGLLTLEEELKLFHEHYAKVGCDFTLIPSEDFSGLEDYIDCLTTDFDVYAIAHKVNGGAQYQRVMKEVEIFLRFSEVAVETKKKDVIQARGVSMASLTWRDVVMKLLAKEAHLPLKQRVKYVGERIKWFFQQQKESVLEFMESVESSSQTRMYSRELIKSVKLMRQNVAIKELVFQTYDNACERQMNLFLELFNNMLTSTFANPWVFLKRGTVEDDGTLDDIIDTKERIPKEIQSRSGYESELNKKIQDIPTENSQIDQAVDSVQSLVLHIYNFIRSQVCDQVELFVESFFKTPMLRRLEEDMSNITLSAVNLQNYEARRERLQADITEQSTAVKEISECIERLQAFKIKREAMMRF